MPSGQRRCQNYDGSTAGSDGDGRTSSSGHAFHGKEHSLSSELKSADLDGEDLTREILACENKVYETFLGPQPDVEAFRKLTLPDYLYINYRRFIWNRDQNLITLTTDFSFSS